MSLKHQQLIAKKLLVIVHRSGIDNTIPRRELRNIFMRRTGEYIEEFTFVLLLQQMEKGYLITRDRKENTVTLTPHIVELLEKEEV